MPRMHWRPRTTVAAVIEREGRFLLVEERVAGRLVLNQPAGHLEEAESIEQAVIREVLEETAWQFSPQALVGVYRWRVPPAGDTYLRFCFSGTVTDHRSERPLDADILRTCWLSSAEIRAAAPRLRSPLVLRALEDHLAGLSYPLGLLVEVD